MARAKLFYNDDGSQFGFIAPDGSEFEMEAVPEEGSVIVEDPDNGNLYEVTLNNYPEDGDLEPNTVYILEECETELTEYEDDEDVLDPTLADPAAAE
jgi:hypothetical protein